jgi:hypothetical protein
MILGVCFYLNDPKIDVLVMKEVFLEESEEYEGEGSLEEGKVPRQIENEDQFQDAAKDNMIDPEDQGLDDINPGEV